MKKSIKIVVLIFVCLVVIGLIDNIKKGTLSTNKTSTKVEETKKDTVSTDTKKETKKEDKKIKIEDKVKEYGNINYTIDLGTGVSNKSLKKSINKRLDKYIRDVKARNDFNKIKNVTFIFMGDTNNGNEKIAQFDFNENALADLGEFNIDNITNKASDKWYSNSFKEGK